MKRIAVVTATRAEYGLLAPVIKELRKEESDTFHVDLIVTGTHLSEKYGNTIDEIINDNVRVDYQVPVSVKSETELDISSNQAEVLVKFTELFMRQKYDGIVLLGDRYETLAVAIAAGNTRTPIFHLCGGDTTEGAIDEWIRHSITKMSYLHFVTNEDSRRRVIQMGESPDRVFNYGSTSIDNVLRVADMTKEEALGSIGLKMCKYALCTYHPVTMENSSIDEQMDEFLKAIQTFPEIEFIVTKSNADQGGARINELLDEAAERIGNLHVYTSLGVRRYLSLMKYAEFVLGNSSSGIIETPVFHVPTVNVGARQKGRLQAENIINCNDSCQDICNAIKMVRENAFIEACRKCSSYYGTGSAASRIAAKIVEEVSDSRINIMKTFYIENAYNCE
ncbi:MAG: UDP-N-acetylglucosamine 2-epimerase (hydrolyzing) [Lachnospiraceae bacterium]|nr:UDP-N-acetylglucosamine 2-epimerase (hydrolyzing) [Lachnospiraceae bacterium]